MASKADLKGMQETELAKDRGWIDPTVRKGEQKREDFMKYGRKRRYWSSATLTGLYPSEHKLSTSEKALKRKRVSVK